MRDDPPQPLVGDADEPGGGQHRHLSDQRHRRLLEQKREPAALARPRNGGPLHPVPAAVRARYPRRDQAMVLEEVQVTPSEFLEIMHLAGPAAFGARELSATIRLQQNLPNMGQTCPYSGSGQPVATAAKPQAPEPIRPSRPSSTPSSSLSMPTKGS